MKTKIGVAILAVCVLLQGCMAVGALAGAGLAYGATELLGIKGPWRAVTIAAGAAGGSYIGHQMDDKDPKQAKEMTRIVRDSLPVSETKTYNEEDGGRIKVTERILQTKGSREEGDEEALYYFFTYEETYSAPEGSKPPVRTKQRMGNWEEATYEDWQRAEELKPVKKATTRNSTRR
jgi:hypothetical protein